MSDVVIRSCPECGQPFAPSYGSQVCCSAACRAARINRLYRAYHAAKRKALETPRTCVVCGKEFRSARKNSVCCSPECQRKHKIRLSCANRRQRKLALVAGKGVNNLGGRPRKIDRLAEIRAERRDAEVRRREFLAARDKTVPPVATRRSLAPDGHTILINRGRVPGGNTRVARHCAVAEVSPWAAKPRKAINA